MAKSKSKSLSTNQEEKAIEDLICKKNQQNNALKKVLQHFEKPRKSNKPK